MAEIDINQVRRITELPEASSLTGIEVIELVQSNSSYKTTIDKIRGASSYDTLVGTILDFSKNTNYTISLTKNTTIRIRSCLLIFMFCMSFPHYCAVDSVDEVSSV